MKVVHRAALIGVSLALYSAVASAQLSNQGMLDQVVMEFAMRATAWQSVVMNAATFLFWTLGTISLVISFGFMAIRKADLGEFFAEFVRFILFFGFFLWLLRNGPSFASSIIQSLSRIGEQASGVSSITPSGIVDVGFLIWKQAINNLSAWSPIDSFVGVFLSAGILILLAVIAVNMLLLLVSAWLLSYAGIFFLGFGGSRWTSDMAINYYKTVLGVAVQIMTMVLLVGIGNDLLSSFYAKMNKGTLNFEELGVMLVFCLALLMLVNRVPPLVASVISGSGIGNAGGIGTFGAGAAVGAAMGAAGMASAAAVTAGAALASGAASAAGGASAVFSAFSKAHENVTAGTDLMSAFTGGRSSSGGSSDAGVSGTPFAQAAGFGSNSGGSSTSSGNSINGNSKSGEKSRDKGSSSTASADNRAAKAVPGSTGPGLLSSAASALGTAGRITADASANLAKGTADVAMAKVASLRDAAVERIADTTGGKIAAAIKARGSGSESVNMPDQQPSPSFGGNSLSAGSLDVDPEAEVAAFTNRRQGNDGTAT